MEEKQCSKCKEIKNKSEFHKRTGRPRGVQSVCKVCKSWIKPKNPIFPEENREYFIKHKYKVDSKYIDFLFASQEHKCAICKTTESKGRWGSFHIDHNHSTGKVRGLLCHACNTGIGLMKENIEILKEAVRYLEDDTKGVD